MPIGVETYRQEQQETSQIPWERWTCLKEEAEDVFCYRSLEKNRGEDCWVIFVLVPKWVSMIHITYSTIVEDIEEQQLTIRQPEVLAVYTDIPFIARMFHSRSQTWLSNPSRVQNSIQSPQQLWSHVKKLQDHTVKLTKLIHQLGILLGIVCGPCR